MKILICVLIAIIFAGCSTKREIYIPSYSYNSEDYTVKGENENLQRLLNIKIKLK